MHLSPTPPVTNHEGGFTLIELSIVLVIIGLIVGGVLVGQDLIRAAEVRATVSQLEKYNTSVNTFRVKYNAIPGDITSADAVTFALTPTTRAGTQGRGDGNGLLEAYCGVAPTGVVSNAGLCGETAMFWGDLTTVGLVDGSFANDQSDTTVAFAAVSGTTGYLPPAKLGRGNTITVYAWNGANYYSIVGGITASAAAGYTGAKGGLTVTQAYNIDKKMDDGLPITGNITAQFPTAGALTVATAAHASSPAAVTDCYDSTATPAYALAINAGAGVNCGLQIKFQ